ncbi:GGDEF domain-containing phosphodiesterase [Alkalilimnicola ehrlichii]|uniref:sensor domain-containing protein n=1 Tax=Alkalilimnicola ehrlichii TaxID=351052 RepID=UPI0011C02346|nr:GGDEF domain-containing phosphodiesterase [Alkalilimnicola ehrlichii]
MLIAVSAAVGWLRTTNLHNATLLRLNEERLKLALQGANEGLWDWDLGSDRLYFSKRWKNMLGYNEEQLSDSALEWIDRLHPEDRQRALDDLDDHLQYGDEGYVSRYRLKHRNGHYLWVESRGHALRDRQGHPFRVVGTMADISDQVRVEEKLRQAATVFESTTEAIVILDRAGRIAEVNKAFERMTGYTRNEVVGRTRTLLSDVEGDQAFFADIDRRLQSRGTWRGEMKARRKNGETFPTWLNIATVRDQEGRFKHFVVVLTDISTLKSSEAKLKALAHYDSLTGLPNRLLLNLTLEKALQRAERHRQRLALLFLDLDRFKLVNDTLGHAAGDELLKTIGQRLQASVRSEDTVARLGGDEFMVLLEDLDQPDDAAAPAEKIIEAVIRPVDIQGHWITPATSIGISIYPDHAQDSEVLIKAADAAMYRAKQSGSNSFQFFTPEMTEQAASRLATEAGLREAIEKQRFCVLYQPQIRLHDFALVGVEALLRWQHPERGLLAPEAFIAVAEETGLTEPIGEWLVNETCQQIMAWRQQLDTPIRLAINLSLRQVNSIRFIEHLIGKLRALNVPAEALNLDLEITESALEQVQTGTNRLLELKRLGVGIVIDDFGTGHSSLNALRQLPIDTLKIDSTFVRDAPVSSNAAAITRAIIALGHTLQLRILAEGVETQEQLDFLRSEGCEEAQGYLFSPAVGVGELTQLLHDPTKLHANLTKLNL